MRRSKMEFSACRRRFLRFFLFLGFLYVSFLLLCELPFVSRRAFPSGASGLVAGDAVARRVALDSEEETLRMFAPVRPFVRSYRLPRSATPEYRPLRRSSSMAVSGLVFGEFNASGGGVELLKSAKGAWEAGWEVFDELRASKSSPVADVNRTAEEHCPNSIMITGEEFTDRKRVMVLPCGLTLGSHITLVARPCRAHSEYDPKISLLKEGEQAVMVSQFMMELQGLKTVDGEEPPRVLHFNPRLKGDWSGKPVIEQNTCYRMQWGSSQRCEGWKSKADEETGL